MFVNKTAEQKPTRQIGKRKNRAVKIDKQT